MTGRFTPFMLRQPMQRLLLNLAVRRSRRKPRRYTLRGMSGRVNHRGWIVLTSVGSDYNPLCVDFFEDPAGGFGFEHFRADPEDGGRWTAVGGFGGSRFESMAQAVQRAKTSVFWLEQEPRARASIDTLLTASYRNEVRAGDRGD